MPLKSLTAETPPNIPPAPTTAPFSIRRWVLMMDCESQHSNASSGSQNLTSSLFSHSTHSRAFGEVWEQDSDLKCNLRCCPGDCGHGLVHPPSTKPSWTGMARSSHWVLQFPKAASCGCCVRRPGLQDSFVRPRPPTLLPAPHTTSGQLLFGRKSNITTPPAKKLEL